MFNSSKHGNFNKFSANAFTIIVSYRKRYLYLLIDYHFPLLIEPLKLVRLWVGNDSETQLGYQPCATTIAARPTIHNERTIFFLRPCILYEICFLFGFRLGHKIDSQGAFSPLEDHLLHRGKPLQYANHPWLHPHFHLRKEKK